jgi:fructosamine-3-kinase
MGIELAKLHQNTAQYFGFEFDNKIIFFDNIFEYLRVD